MLGSSDGQPVQQIVDVVEVGLERVEPVPERAMGQQLGAGSSCRKRAPP